MTRINFKKTLIATSALYFCLLPASIMPAMFAPMMAAGNLNLDTYLAIYSLLTLPVVLLFSLLVPWLFYRLKRYKTALVVALLPCINGVIILFWIVLPEMRSHG